MISVIKPLMDCHMGKKLSYIGWTQRVKQGLMKEDKRKQMPIQHQFNKRRKLTFPEYLSMPGILHVYSCLILTQREKNL